jgi:hypothetical protein
MRICPNSLRCVAGLAFASVANACAAQALEFAGSARAAEWSHSRDLDDAGPVSTIGVWARATARLGERAMLVGDAWAQGADHRQGDASVRELFVKASVGRVDVSVGRQVIAWGRADAFNPTDSVGPRDYKRLAVEDSDQRDGADVVSAQWFPSEGWSVQTLWLPDFRGDRVPLRTFPGESLSANSPRSRSQYAVKLDRTGGRVDWSLSWFDGVDRLPDLALVAQQPGGIAVALSNHRVRTLGADFSTSAAEVTWRGEVGWSQRDAGGAASGDFFRKRPELMAVLGGDRAFGDLDVNLQAFGQWVPRWRDPDQLGDPIAIAVATEQSAINNQPGRHQFGATWRASTSWANEAWQAECSGVASLTTHGNVVRLKLKHALADRWRLVAGADRYAGPDDTVFGQLRANSTAYVELSRLF